MKPSWPIVFSLVLLAGCQSAAFSEGDYQSQGLQAGYTRESVPGYVVVTREDGSATTAPLLAPVPTPAPAPTPRASVAVAAPVPPPRAPENPVVSVVVVPPQPAVSSSYRVTPETQKGDKVASSRVMTWAGEAPGSVVEKVATQKEKRTHNPLPAVSVDATGIHAKAGGGSVDDQAGQSLFQRAWTWMSDVLKGWAWWVVVLGIAALAFFILPILFPVLKPIFSSIMDGLGRMWTWITGEFGRLMTWLKSVHSSKTTTASTTAGNSTPIVLPVPATSVPTTASPVVPSAPSTPTPAVPASVVPATPPTPTQQLQADAAALSQQAQALAQKVAGA